MTYEEINAVYRDLQGYYIDKIEEVFNRRTEVSGMSSIVLGFVDKRNIMLADEGYLDEQEWYYILARDEETQTLYLHCRRHVDCFLDTANWDLDKIGVDGLRDILQAINNR